MQKISFPKKKDKINQICLLWCYLLPSKWCCRNVTCAKTGTLTKSWCPASSGSWEMLRVLCLSSALSVLPSPQSHLLQQRLGCQPWLCFLSGGMSLQSEILWIKHNFTSEISLHLHCHDHTLVSQHVFSRFWLRAFFLNQVTCSSPQSN